MCFVKDRKIGYLGLIQAPSVANRQSLLCNQEQKLPKIKKYHPQAFETVNLRSAL